MISTAGGESKLFSMPAYLAIPLQLCCSFEHVFSAFCSNKHMKKSAVRTLKSVEIERRGGELRLGFTGNGFLYNMVRILTGTLLELGSGQRSIESVSTALESLDREQAGFTAPAQGLILWDVKY